MTAQPLPAPIPPPVPLPARDRTAAGLSGTGAAAAVAGFVAPPPDPALGPDAIPFLPRGVRLAQDRVRGMAILQAPERAMQLDPVGEAILAALDGRPLRAIVADLAARYAAPADQIDADVRAFLQGLIDRRMVFVRAP